MYPVSKIQPNRKRAQSVPVCGGHSTIASCISKSSSSSSNKKSKRGIGSYSTKAAISGCHREWPNVLIENDASKEADASVTGSDDGAGNCSDETVIGNSGTDGSAPFPVLGFTSLNLHISHFSNSLATAGYRTAQTDVNNSSSSPNDFPIDPFLYFMESGLLFFYDFLETKSATYIENAVVSRFLHVIDKLGVKNKKKYGSLPSFTDHVTPLADKWTFPPSSKREKQTRRRDILRHAAREHSTRTDGKPIPEAKVLWSYGLQQIQLGGHTAVNRKMDTEEACDECKFATPPRDCVRVKKDWIWNRGQCVECVLHKTACSVGRDRVGEDVV